MVINQLLALAADYVFRIVRQKLSAFNKKAILTLTNVLNAETAGFRCMQRFIIQQTMIMPRAIRAIFSNVREKSPNTGIQGRGTEEMKTNDVTNRFPTGKVGFACEMGRPSTGTSFLDVETIANVVVAHGAELETNNPTAIIFEENNPGIIKEEFRNERALSVIIEGMIEPEALPGLLKFEGSTR